MVLTRQNLPLKENGMNVDSYLASLGLQTTSSETFRAYRQTLSRFEAFLRDRKLRVTQVKRSTVTEFMAYLTEHKGRTVGEALAPATVVRYLAVLSSYYDFLGDNSDGRIKNPVTRVKRPKIHNDEEPRAVDDETLATLVDGITDVRDKAIVLVYLDSGLRLSELARLNRDSIVTRKRTSAKDVVESYGYAEVVGKGEKRRDVLIGPKAIIALREYIRTSRRNDQNPALFLSSHRKRISDRAIQHVLDRWCKRLGLQHIHVHQLRHSFATRNVNAGMSLSVLQSLLGHKYPATSGRYFRIRSDRKTREYFAVMEFIRDTSPL
jgi:integrase/recombinase XerC